MLYYLFLLFPGLHPAAYLALVLSAFGFLAWVGKDHLAGAMGQARQALGGMAREMLHGSGWRRWELISTVILIVVVLGGSAYWFGVPLWLRPIVGHDVVGYAFMGKLLFHERSLQPIWVKDFSDRGFYYLTLHMPSFSLLLVWENLLASLAGVAQDFYFRTIGLYYALLLMAIQYIWLARTNKLLALAGWVLLLTSSVFLDSMKLLHIDSFRIFFLSVSWIFLAYHWKNQDFTSLVGFSLFGGLAAAAHALCGLLTCMGLAFLPLFMKGGLGKRVSHTAQACGMVLLFGGAHYVFDLCWGRRWLFF
jgi:hypothetical protein